jgi:hypothetical protein
LYVSAESPERLETPLGGFNVFHLSSAGSSHRKDLLLGGPGEPKSNDKGLSSLGFTGALVNAKILTQTADSQSY